MLPRTSINPIPETLFDLLDLYAQAHASTIVGQRFAIENFISVRLGLNQEASSASLPRYTHPDMDKEDEQDEQENSEQHKRNGSSLPHRQHHHQQQRPHSNKSTPKTPKTPQTPDEMNGDAARGGPGRSKAGMKEGTLRYMLDVERAENEQRIVDSFFVDEIEEYEVEEEVRVDQRRR